MERCPDIGPICEERDEPPQKHDQRLLVSEWKAGFAYGVSDALALDVQVPFKWVRTSIVYRRLDGTAFTPDYENIHHRDETLSGIGDPRIGGRTGWRAGDATLSAVTGLSLPLGRIEKNPFELAREGRAHEHIQFGTGTFDPFVSLMAHREIAGFHATAAGELVAPIFEGPYGYRAGTRGTVSAAASRAVWRGIRAGGSLAVSHEEAERWDGRIEEEGNLGRTDVLAGLSATVPVQGATVSLDVSTPVYTQAVGSQLSYPAILSLTLSL